MRIDVVDPIHRQEPMLAVGRRIAPGELDGVGSFDTVDGADVNAIRSDDLHVFLNFTGVEHVNLRLTPG